MYCKAKKKFGAIQKLLKIFIFENLLHKKGPKGGISIDADSGPPRYVLLCCGGICHQPDIFIQIGLAILCPRISKQARKYLKIKYNLVDSTSSLVQAAPGVPGM